MSLPLRECGLKYILADKVINVSIVTPLAGVWIEILPFNLIFKSSFGHSPCGSVD